MPKMNQHFLEFSRFLNSNDVRYLLIGGHAVGYHGWARNTKDIDFWIAGDSENQARTVAAIRQFAFPNAGADLFIETNAVVRFGAPPLRIEVLRTISGIAFDEAWRNRVYWVYFKAPGLIPPPLRRAAFSHSTAKWSHGRVSTECPCGF